MRTFTAQAALAFGALGLAGCAAVPTAPPLPPAPGPARGVVFCVEGAGNWGTGCDALRRAVADADLPVEVRAFPWSYGPGRVIADQTDYEHARAAGRKLAGEIADLRAAHPDLAVDVVAHSAGSAVALAAAEASAPGAVDRLILIAPAVSSDYDLRLALAASRQGVDVFPSGRDFCVLGVGVAVVGTTDRRWAPAAGWGGFTLPPGAAPAAYGQVREHPWAPADVAAGHLGGHYGAFRAAYLRDHVAPLLQADAAR